MTTQKQREVWKHNSFLGHARMMQMQAQAIIKSKTATNAAQEFAVRIYDNARGLELALKKRRPGT